MRKRKGKKRRGGREKTGGRKKNEKDGRAKKKG